jgi:AcrR family transcriptional regulator
MARGISSLSIPEIAREAGVSVPTVYRHFGSKDELLAAVYPHVAHRVGLDTLADPVTLGDLRDGVLVYLDRLAHYSALDLDAVASPVGDEVRHATMAHRLERLSRLADAVEPPLAQSDRERITRLLAVLTASASLRMWRDHLGSSVEQTADDIVWVIGAAIAASREGAR